MSKSHVAFLLFWKTCLFIKCLARLYIAQGIACLRYFKPETSIITSRSVAFDGLMLTYMFRLKIRWLVYAPYSDG